MGAILRMACPSLLGIEFGSARFYLGFKLSLMGKRIDHFVVLSNNPEAAFQPEVLVSDP